MNEEGETMEHKECDNTVEGAVGKLQDKDYDDLQKMLEDFHAVFCRFIENQEFQNPENKEMSWAIGRLVVRAFANFVGAFKVTARVPPLSVAVGAFKIGFDGAVKDMVERLESVSFDDLEDPSHNMV